MMHKKRIFMDTKSRGSMLTELLLSVALAMMAIPFIFKYQQDTITHAENIAITKQMSNVQNALERYIVTNRESLMKTVGKTITRIDMKDLESYGIDYGIIEDFSDKYQVRVLKSYDSNGQATLQGVIVFASPEITPLRTRQLVGLGENMGFVDGTRAYGSFGTWHADTVDLGISGQDGIIQTTTIKRGNDLYLWRIPSDDPDDATMLSSLSLGGHDINDIKFLDINSASFDEMLTADVVASTNLTFQNRTTIDTVFTTKSATVSGTLSSDSRNLEIANKMVVSDLGKFASFTTGDLYASNLTLSGLSISPENEIATIKVNDKLNMAYGRITAASVSVGYAGSITPHLSVSGQIQDSVNPDYYWNVAASMANFADLSIPDLNTMASRIVARESDVKTVSGKLFSAIASNNNATVGDFLGALNEIKIRVREKYNMLNLK